MSERFTRAERLQQISALVAGGLTHRQIAAALGISRSTVRNVLYDPDGAKQLALRVRYQGECLDCGGPTDGSNGRAKASIRCLTCQLAHQRTEEWKVQHQIWTRELLIARIQEWAALYGQPPAMVDWNPNMARRRFHDEVRARRWEDANGHWPWFTLVVDRFGSWNEGIKAAGFTPRATTGTVESASHRRPRRQVAA